MSTNSNKTYRILQRQFGHFVQQAEVQLAALCSEFPPDTPSTTFNAACDGLAVMSQHSPKLVIDAIMNWRLTHKPKAVGDNHAAPELAAAAKFSGVNLSTSGISKVHMVSIRLYHRRETLITRTIPERKQQ
jgi:hypothetical protein